MSTVQFRALAVCAWLLAFCFALASAAALESYFDYRRGDRASAVFEKVEGSQVTLQYTDKGQPRTFHVSKARFDALAKNNAVELMIYPTNRQAILAADHAQELPSVLVVLGLIVSLAGGWWLWRIPTRQAQQRAQRKDPWQVLLAAAARTRNLQLGIGGFLLAAGALFVAIPLLDHEGGVGARVFLWALAAVTLFFGGRGIQRGIRLLDPARNEIVELIDKRPADLVWFYVQQIVVNGVPTLTLILCKSDGKQLTLSLVAEDRDGVLAEVARRAPHAKQGYDPELERQWKQSPARWRPRTTA